MFKTVKYLLTPSLQQVFLQRLFYTQGEIDEFIRIADADGNGEVWGIFLHIPAASSPALTMHGRSRSRSSGRSSRRGSTSGASAMSPSPSSGPKTSSTPVPPRNLSTPLAPLPFHPSRPTRTPGPRGAGPPSSQQRTPSATHWQAASRGPDARLARADAGCWGGADGIVTQQELSANFWDCSDPYFELKASMD